MLQKLHETRKGLRETIQSDGDETAIRAAFGKVAEVEADLAVERAKLHKKIKPILTDDQIEKAKEIEAKIDDFVFDALSHLGQKLGE
jgi:Spy/CpxP family protein refolding chaperone